MWGGAPNPHREAPAPRLGAIELLLGPRQGGPPGQCGQSGGPDWAPGRSVQGRAPWARIKLSGQAPWGGGLPSMPQPAEGGEGEGGQGCDPGPCAWGLPHRGPGWLGAPLGSCCLSPPGVARGGPAWACSQGRDGRACWGPGGGLVPYFLADSPPGRQSSRSGPPPDSHSPRPCHRPVPITPV